MGASSTSLHAAGRPAQPSWVLPVVLLASLAALIIGDPGRIDRQKTWLRVTTSAVIALLTLANLFGAARLVGDILTNNKLFAANATALLATGGVIWATNVIAFALWYWDLDRGGAAARRTSHANPAFVFPEMLNTSYVPATWVPEFADYLSLAFWTATAYAAARTARPAAKVSAAWRRSWGRGPTALPASGRSGPATECARRAWRSGPGWCCWPPTGCRMVGVSRPTGDRVAGPLSAGRHAASLSQSGTLSAVNSGKCSTIIADAIKGALPT